MKTKLKIRPGVQILLALVILVAITACKKQSSNIVYNKEYIEQIKAARKQIGLYLSINSIPGAAVAVSKNGQLVYSEGMGWASKELEVPATRHTKFRIGELSELFTSFIYLRMIEEGKLKPYSSVQNYLPDFPEKQYRIDLYNLVNQTSGIRETTVKEENSPAYNISLQNGLNYFKNDPLIISPNSYQLKSMFNYNLLGVVMEKTTETPFRNILKEYLTDTLNLTNTSIDNPLATIKNRTDFFDQNIIANTVNAQPRDMRYRAPSQGLLSNPEDLVKFADAILYSNLLSDKTKKSMFNPIPLKNNSPSEMTNGWSLFTTNSGVKFYGRISSVTGGTAALLIYPEYGITVAFTTNLSTSKADTPIFDIAGIFIDIK